jgi:hypothetical protein
VPIATTTLKSLYSGDRKQQSETLNTIGKHTIGELENTMGECKRVRAEENRSKQKGSAV